MATSGVGDHAEELDRREQRHGRATRTACSTTRREQYIDIADGGGNVQFAGTTCPGLSANPMLGALAQNGGPTPTMLPDAGGAAIGVGPGRLVHRARGPARLRARRRHVRRGGRRHRRGSVGPTATATALISSANPSVAGSEVTYTATVSPPPIGGTVSFTDDGATIAGAAPSRSRVAARRPARRRTGPPRRIRSSRSTAATSTSRARPPRRSPSRSTPAPAPGGGTGGGDGREPAGRRRRRRPGPPPPGGTGGGGPAGSAPAGRGAPVFGSDQAEGHDGDDPRDVQERGRRAVRLPVHLRGASAPARQDPRRRRGSARPSRSAPPRRRWRRARRSAYGSR